MPSIFSKIVAKEIPDEATLGRLFTVAARIAADLGIAASGYRLLVNCNKDGGQEVYHLHLHLLGGRPLGPMLARTGQQVQPPD